MQYFFGLVEVEFCPSIGLIGTDGMDLEALFINLLVVSDTYIYAGVRNCLVVTNGYGYRVLLAHMEYLGETGWIRRPVHFQM